MIDATTHTRKIWRSHFDGADSTNSYDHQTVKIFTRYLVPTKTRYW
jgi:hypothetical protein